ncbi:MAG: hypothetical protein K8T89_21275, partial [Planctomycetes bacterium]|nr:hypothetical protein [Planctomycetota bacterium]
MRPLCLSGVTLFFLVTSCHAVPKPSERWIDAGDMTYDEICNMKKEMTIDAKMAQKLFKSDYPYLRETWEKEIAEKFEDSDDAKSFNAIRATYGERWAERENEKQVARLIRFSDKEIIVLVLRERGGWISRKIYECSAHFRIPRTGKVDELFCLDQLEKSYGAEFKGLKQGSCVEDVTKALGEHDAEISFQACYYFRYCYFKHDVTITF